MREIAFRFWEPRDSTMLSWLCVCQTAFNRESSPGQRPAGAGFSLMYQVFTDSRFIKMQSTGCRDSVGVEIYEGDLVEVPWNGGKAVGLVIWDVRDICFRLWFIDRSEGWQMCFGWTEENAKVIGNEHQHPELMPPGTDEQMRRLARARCSGV